LAHLTVLCGINTEVALHTGSADVTARVRVLEKRKSARGNHLGAIILDEPLAVVNGDRYVIRSPMDTIGGGLFLMPIPKNVTAVSVPNYREF